jgi:hypothetical protein
MTGDFLLLTAAGVIRLRWWRFVFGQLGSKVNLEERVVKVMATTVKVKVKVREN